MGAEAPETEVPGGFPTVPQPGKAPGRRPLPVETAGSRTLPPALPGNGEKQGPLGAGRSFRQTAAQGRPALSSSRIAAFGFCSRASNCLAQTGREILSRRQHKAGRSSCVAWRTMRPRPSSLSRQNSKCCVVFLAISLYLILSIQFVILFVGFRLLLSLFHDAVIEEQAQPTDGCGDHKDDDGKLYSLHAQRVAADGGGVTEGMRATEEMSRKVRSFMGVSPMK